jgi:ATP-dependent protease ClpP protease subunit
MTIYAEGQFGIELTAKWLRGELAKAGGQDVEIHLNSPGGSAFEASSMMDELRRYRGKKTIRIVALAASAASRFCTAADEVICTSNSAHMRHLASAGTYGDSSDHSKTLEILHGVDRQMAADYAAWSGKTVDQELSEMEEEAWLWGYEIYEQGYATSYEETRETRDRETALADARDRFAACYRPPTPYEVAAFAGTTRTPAKKTRILTREDIQAAELAEMDIEEYFFWLDKIEGVKHGS